MVAPDGLPYLRRKGAREAVRPARPAKAVCGGLAVAQGGIVVTCVDGSVVGIR